MLTTPPNSCVSISSSIKEHEFADIDRLILKECKVDTFKSYIYRGIISQTDRSTFIYINCDGHIYIMTCAEYCGITTVNNSSMCNSNIKLLLDVVKVLSYDITDTQIFTKHEIVAKSIINRIIIENMYIIDKEKSMIIEVLDAAPSVHKMSNEQIINNIRDIYNVVILNTSRQSEEIVGLAAQLEAAHVEIKQLKQENAKLVHTQREVAEVTTKLKSVVNYYYADVKPVSDANDKPVSDANDKPVSNANDKPVSDADTVTYPPW